jgi:hypothetical protein
LLAHGCLFSPGTPASSPTKTGRHDIAEILLKVALNHQKSNKKSEIILLKTKYPNQRVYLLTTRYSLFNNACYNMSSKI